MSLYTPFNKWVTDEHKLFTESVQKFYNDEMRPNIEDWVNKGVVSKTFWIVDNESTRVQNIYHPAVGSF